MGVNANILSVINTSLSSQEDASLPPIVLYILGQSNAVGLNTKSPTTDLTSSYPAYAGEFSNVYVWNTNACEKMNATGTNNNQYPDLGAISKNGGFAMEVSMCKDLADATGRNVYLFKYAIGATGLITAPANGTWETTAGDIYDDVVTEIALFNAWMDANIGEYVKSSIIWFQGENDAVSTNYDPYLVEEDKFVIGIRSAVRSDFYTNWITIGIQDTLDAYRGEINQSKQILSSITQSLTYKASQGYSVNADQIHLTSAGQIALGQDLAIDIAANLEGSATDDYIGVVWPVNIWTANDGFVISGANGNYLTGNGTQNNGKAYCKRYIPDGSNGYFEMTIPVGFASTGLYPFGIDLKNNNSAGGWNGASFVLGFVIDNPNASVNVTEGGATVGVSFAVSEGDKMKIYIDYDLDEVRLYQNDVLKHTYATTPTGSEYIMKCGTHTNYLNNPKFDDLKIWCEDRLQLSDLTEVDLSNW